MTPLFKRVQNKFKRTIFWTFLFVRSATAFFYRPILSLRDYSLSKIYRYFQFRFKFIIPKEFRLHRAYFTQQGRGFGEDAFHAFWYQVFKEFRPIRCLEIGVYRGQTVSLWQLLSRHFGIRDTSIYGMTPLVAANDEVSLYPDLDYKSDILQNFENFEIPPIKFFQDYSTSNPSQSFIREGNWDLVYIDGGHDFDIVKKDFENALIGLKPNGILVLDDSSLFLVYEPIVGAFKGHPGPSRVLNEFAIKEMEHLLTVGHLNLLRKYS